MKQGYSHYRAGCPQPASPFAGAPDPPKWALTPFSLPTPPDWPCSTGMDTLWITSASLSLTTSSRASSTSTPLAKCPRSCSKNSPHVPPAYSSPSLSSLSQSVSPSPSPPHGLLPVPASHPQHQCSVVQPRPGNGLVSFSGVLPCPVCMGREEGLVRERDTPCAPGMSLGNGPLSPSSQHAQSRGCLFCIILHNLSSINLGGFFFF